MKTPSLLLVFLPIAIAAVAVNRRQEHSGITAPGPTPKGISPSNAIGNTSQTLPYNSDPVKIWLPEGLAQVAQSFNEITKPARIASVLSLTPKIRQDAKRRLVRFGPYHLLPAGTPKDPTDLVNSIRLDPDGQNFLINVTGKDGFCSDCTILSGQMNLVFENGTQADLPNGVYLHHVLTRDVSKDVEQFISACPTRGTTLQPQKGPTFSFPFTGAGGAEFINVGNDNNKAPTLWSAVDGTLLAGYHVKQNDVFSIVAEILNYRDEEIDVYLTHDVEYLPTIQGRNTQQTEISVTGCTMSDPFTSPTGPMNTTSNNYIFFTDGDIIDSKGHLHDGGVRMYMFINDKFICSSDAKYDDPLYPTISEMTHCTGPIPVKKGDVFTMTSEYDLLKHPLRSMTEKIGEPDAMGTWSLVFAPK